MSAPRVKLPQQGLQAFARGRPPAQLVRAAASGTGFHGTKGQSIFRVFGAIKAAWVRSSKRVLDLFVAAFPPR